MTLSTWWRNPLDALPAEPLITTKLYVPGSRLGMVPRLRLAARLNSGLACKLTLVSAPAGAGKTTLLADWLQMLSHGSKSQESHRPSVAWLSLDESDSDPDRFIRYLVAAVQQIVPAAGESSLALLASSPATHTSNTSALIGALVNEIAASAKSGVLVLDDYHVITSAAVHEATAFLLDHLPAHFHLVIATREDPPLPLARLRARAQLNELRVADLRFTTNEAAEFLRASMGLDLSSEEVEAIEHRTEGWIAGLQLAALSMREQADKAGFIAAFAGTHRHVLDYLVEEVLHVQPEHVQKFLLYISICGRVCAPLCAALLQEASSPELEGIDPQVTLQWVEGANIFLTPLDTTRVWYRYHRLFADLLISILESADPALVARLRRRAARWFAEHGSPAEAIELALAAKDFVYTASLLSESMKHLDEQPHHLHMLRRWLQMLPDELIRADPRLSLDHAWILASAGRFEVAEQYTALVDPHLGNLVRTPGGHPVTEALTMKGEAAVLLTLTAASMGDIARAEAMAEQARELLPADRLATRAALELFLAGARTSEGRFQAAVDAYAAAESLARSAGDGLALLMAIHSRASLHVMQGELHEAKAAYMRALQLEDVQLPAILGMPHIGLGQVLAEWNRLDEAAGHLETGIALLSAIPDWNTNLVDGYVAMFRVVRAKGDAEGGGLAAGLAGKLAEGSGRARISKPAEWLAVLHWLYSGQPDRASRWAEQVSTAAKPLSPLRQENEAIVLARVYLATGGAERALRVLIDAQKNARTANRKGNLIEIEALRALALWQIGQTSEAVRTLAGALALAQPGGYIQLFLDAGEPMRTLLQEVLKRYPATTDYSTRLLAAFAPRPGHTSLGGASIPTAGYEAEPLSQREIQVLRLLVSGLSGPDIAAALTVGTSTVKTHIKNIYDKLGVHTRLQAVERARDLMLL